MIHFKNNGFTLIEALISLTVMGVVLTPIFMAQSSIFQMVIRRTQAIDRIIYAQSFIIEVRRAIPKDAQQFVQEKKINKPATQLKYEIKQVSTESAFKDVPNLYKEQVTIDWQQGRNKQSDMLVQYIFMPKD